MEKLGEQDLPEVNYGIARTIKLSEGDLYTLLNGLNIPTEFLSIIISSFRILNILTYNNGAYTISNNIGNINLSIPIL